MAAWFPFSTYQGRVWGKDVRVVVAVDVAKLDDGNWEALADRREPRYSKGADQIGPI